MLVEDEAIIRKGIRYSVPWEEYGCCVVGEAENGQTGEEKIAELRPDIVVTDITMPLKSGLEMIRDTHDQYKYIPIILTGYSEFEYAQQAIRSGVSGYVLKPLDIEEMCAVLERAAQQAGDIISLLDSDISFDMRYIWISSKSVLFSNNDIMEMPV